ncbi:hypothetical protein F5B22DRAFT_108091 [Xylaria bambusicola]|uniref:uncharacterized protein n=1 Tax=Xylaria bambusicola TaxID=326684 RepID=UPI0020077CB8|nr:uncharacterized protein F5B22DRAFT_108091 [Xylaria bambusicola]KAI0517506.1 hypothetical protein F5B22DRAFT_108091 [Xylaria bambusicola]
MCSIDRFKAPWVADLRRATSTRSADLPSYPSSDPESLVSVSHIASFEIGTGASIYTRSLLPAILKAKHEIILVTCFWAQSSTLNALRETLQQLATLRAEHVRTSHPDRRTLSPLKVQICFSSRSFFQKLLHTRSRDGYIYPRSKWVSKLGLPDPQLLEAGLIELRVKTLFFLPFSVMHPKFLIIDRERAWLPSANVSWESWLEGCVEITGDAVASLLRFYCSVWDRDLKMNGEPPAIGSLQQEVDSILSPGTANFTSIQSPATHLITLQLDNIPTILLPSSHHSNPQFRPFPWQQFPGPPITPLNCAILRLLAMAEKKIYIQTPNLTSAAVMDALLEALTRGIDVTVVTSKGMMILEQLLTGGTITSWCLRAFVKRYEKLVKHPMNTRGEEDSNGILDLEGRPSRPGSLEILYFHSLQENQQQQIPEEPVHSHLKLVTIDDEYAVLGSGNMDRASWFTSQELGILFQSNRLVTQVSDAVSQALRGRVSVFFKSKH